MRRLIAATERTRERCGETDQRHLFAAAVVGSGRQVRFRRWDSHRAEGRFSRWLTVSGVQITGDPHIRRLRKSTKVEKAIVFGGRIADAADDHHEETFRGHYAQGTTLRVISGKVITTAQQHWLDKAVEGPSVFTAGAADDAGHLETLGLTAQEIEALRQGALDMGVTGCRNPYESPYSPAGELCVVAPLRCLECANAWILPSHLPQLLLFADHLDQLKLRLSPRHFTAMWGQISVNLQAVLAERTDQEKTLARNLIDTGQATLHLPLSAGVEFDA